MTAEYETDFGLFERVVDLETMKHGTVVGILLLPEITTYQIRFGLDSVTFDSEEWRGHMQIASLEVTP